MSRHHCKGAMLVCECHPDNAWTPERCEWGAGMPCPVCRPQRSALGSDEAVSEAVRRAVDDDRAGVRLPLMGSGWTFGSLTAEGMRGIRTAVEPKQACRCSPPRSCWR
jgi:hypothetical protein